jgi:hypothetical protein
MYPSGGVSYALYIVLELNAFDGGKSITRAFRRGGA